MKKLKTLFVPFMALSFLASCGSKKPVPVPPPPVPVVYNGGIDLTYMRINAANGSKVKFSYKCTAEQDDLKVYWGDGTVDRSNAHTYKVYGRYHIYITGHIDEIALVDENGELLAADNNWITNIVLSNHVTNIPEKAFMLGTRGHLESILIPKTVTTIGSSAFNVSDAMYYCFEDKRNEGWAEDCFESIKSDNIVSGLNLYMKDDDILYATYDDSISGENIASVYLCCDLELKDAVIEETITINEVDYTVTSIWDSAFYAMDTLETLKTPDSLVFIDGFAFVDCKNLKSIELNERLEEIGNDAFKNIGITSLTIPSTVKTLGNNVFRGCSKLTKVEFKNNTTELEKIEASNVFNECHNISEFNLPYGITEMPDLSIREMAITEITIPLSVTKIGMYAIDRCTSLEMIDASKFTEEENIPSAERNPFTNANPGKKVKIKISSSLTKENFIDKGWPKEEPPFPGATEFEYVPE